MSRLCRQWCQLQKRKQNMVRLLEKMQTYQGDLVMKDINAALPDGMRVLSNDDIERYAAPPPPSLPPSVSRHV